jgi:hypothetical protein
LAGTCGGGQSDKRFESLPKASALHSLQADDRAGSEDEERLEDWVGHWREGGGCCSITIPSLHALLHKLYEAR